MQARAASSETDSPLRKEAAHLRHGEHKYTWPAPPSPTRPCRMPDFVHTQQMVCLLEPPPAPGEELEPPPAPGEELEPPPAPGEELEPPPAPGEGDAPPAGDEGGTMPAAGMVARARAGRAPGARGGGDEELEDDEDDDEDEEDEAEDEEDGAPVAAARRLAGAGATRPAIGASNHLRPCFVNLLFPSSRVRSSHHCFLFVAWNGIAGTRRRLNRSRSISSPGSKVCWSMKLAEEGPKRDRESAAGACTAGSGRATATVARHSTRRAAAAAWRARQALTPPGVRTARL